MTLSDCQTLDDYLAAYSSQLGRQMAEVVRPLHTPSEDAVEPFDTYKPPLEAQAHVIAASVKQLERDDAVIVSAECGTGKTLMGALTADMHARGRPYRAIVMCPPHLVHKWDRELQDSLPGVTTEVLMDYTQLVNLPAKRPRTRDWFIVSENRAKMGCGWRPIYFTRRRPVGVPHCCSCGAPVTEIEKETQREVPIPVKKLQKKKHICPKCSEPLWQWTGQPSRWPVSTYIQKKMKGMFDYFIVDEVHQARGEETAIAQSMSELVSATKKVIALTGTLAGGYATNLRTLLYRLSPKTLIDMGLDWNSTSRFVDLYGRHETAVYSKGVTRDGEDNRRSVGSCKSQRTMKTVRPGIMPTLYADHLLDKTVFLSLDEVAENLPDLREFATPIEMDSQQSDSYQEMEDALRQALLANRNNMSLLSTMLRATLTYPDHPYDFDELGFYAPDEDNPEVRRWIHVCHPRNLSQSVVRPKEQHMLDIIREEKEQGRKVWVFSNMVGRYDVNARLDSVCVGDGLDVRLLRSSVPTKDRENWIYRNAPESDVIISNQELVQTGLDFFDKEGTFNFPTLIFYFTGYDCYSIRQASRRAWRIGQLQECRVHYLFYAQTMQARAMTLMARKLAASMALEGRFSAEGMAAMAGEDSSIEMELSRSLVNNLDDLDAVRAWSRVPAVSLREASRASDVPVVRRQPEFTKQNLFSLT